jgi:hypothetical protein
MLPLSVVGARFLACPLGAGKSNDLGDRLPLELRGLLNLLGGTQAATFGASPGFEPVDGASAPSSYGLPGCRSSGVERSGPLNRYSSTNARNTSSSNLGMIARWPSPS